MLQPRLTQWARGLTFIRLNPRLYPTTRSTFYSENGSSHSKNPLTLQGSFSSKQCRGGIGRSSIYQASASMVTSRFRDTLRVYWTRSRPTCIGVSLRDVTSEKIARRLGRQWSLKSRCMINREETFIGSVYVCTCGGIFLVYIFLD